MKTPRYSIMQCGRQSLVLEEGINYDSFSAAAEKWARQLDLHVTEKIDGAGERLWLCERAGRPFWLAFDDWFPEISLEPRDNAAAAEILVIGTALGVSEPKT